MNSLEIIYLDITQLMPVILHFFVFLSKILKLFCNSLSKMSLGSLQKRRLNAVFDGSGF